MTGLIAAIPLSAQGESASHARELIEQAKDCLVADGDVKCHHLLESNLCCAAAVERPGGSDSLVDTARTGGVAVVVVGHPMPVNTGQQPDKGTALSVAENYLRDGSAGVERFDGSFFILIADDRNRSLFVWTDRTGTRPLFMACTNDFLLLATQVKCFSGIDGIDRTIVPGSLAAMLCNASLMDEHTYWRGVRLIGPASRLSVINGAIAQARYWHRKYESAPDKLVGPQEAGTILAEAVRRQLMPFRKPVLALSGGYDSRFILAACARTGMSIDTITWGVDGLDSPDTDFQLGRQLTEQFGFAHTARVKRLEEFPANAAKVVWMTDGLTGHLGGHPEGDAVARELAEEGYDAVVMGNQLFDGGLYVRSVTEGLHQAGLNYAAKDFLLLRALLRRDRVDAVARDYQDQKQALLDSILCQGAEILAAGDPNDIKDYLYWRARFPRLIGSQAAVYRRHLEYVSPLLDIKVLNLDVHCTAEQRSEKRWFKKTLCAAYPEAFSLPTAEQHSRADWRHRLRETGPVQRYIVETLLQPCASFDAWFDRDAVKAWLALAMPEGRLAPWPADVGPLRRMKAGLRGVFYKHTVKARRVINLLTLKLWFEQFGRGE